MKLEHFGMAEPGDCRVVFSAAAEELEATVQAEKAAPDAPQDEDDLLTAAVNRAILEGFSSLFAQLMKENDLQPVTDPDFELLAVNRAEGFRAGVQFFCLPPLELGEYTGFTQPIQPRPIRELTIELEINRRHGDEDRAADAEGKRALRAKVTQDIYAQRCQQARAVAEQALIAQLGTHVTGPLPKQLVAGNYFAEQRQFNLRMQANGVNFDQYLKARRWKNSEPGSTPRPSASCAAGWVCCWWRRKKGSGRRKPRWMTSLPTGTQSGTGSTPSLPTTAAAPPSASHPAAPLPLFWPTPPSHRRLLRQRC